VPSERRSIKEQSTEYVDGRVVFSDRVRGDLRSPRTTSLTLWEGDKSLTSASHRTQTPQRSSPQLGHYINYAIPVP
jgi:hypothetical protein